MSTRSIIALSGLSGAGKSTTVTNLSRKIDLVHLSASALIQEQEEREFGARSSSESLRKGDVKDNQLLFKRAFQMKVNDVTKSIVLDCHTAIDTPLGLELVPAETFFDLGLTDFAFLFVDPAELLRRRKDDRVRSRPVRSAAEISFQQGEAQAHAIHIADRLCVPFVRIDMDDPVQQLFGLLRK